jgi:hypothetical protein
MNRWHKISASAARWLALLTLTTLGFSLWGHVPVSQTLPTLSVNDVTLSEDSCQNKSFVFTVTLSKLLSKGVAVTVNYATSDGSNHTSLAALASMDYVPVAGTLIFSHDNVTEGPHGSYLLTVNVPLGNYVVSSGTNQPKSFTLTLSGAANATISKAQGVGTLLNAAATCAPTTNAGCFGSVNFCGASVACQQVNRSATATPYCALAGLGITPAADPNFAECSSAGIWGDADGDGFSNAAEAQGYLDVNGDGIYEADVDVPLPDADPNKPDIYVQYDWMDYGLNDIACSTDSDCTSLGSNHAGETCTGPATPNSAHSCIQACGADSDCTALGPSHVGDRCILNACEHTHDPEVLAPGALQAVVDAFAAHGFNLHVGRGHSLPSSHVVSFRQPQSQCEGASVPAGTLGAYAVNFYDLKKSSFDEAKAPVFHYAVFAQLSACDSDTHCTSGCPAVKGTTPAFGQTGQSEISGNDFIVSMGDLINDLGVPPTIFTVGGTFMHELGHNLGLHHGGGSTPAGTICQGPACEDTPTYKPNYLSVMNYKYQYSGILEGIAIGSSTIRTCSTNVDCSIGSYCNRSGTTGICARLDYSTQTLPTGGNTPGALTENGQLNEPAGLGSGTSDLFTYDDGRCAFQVGATDGPVNWDGVGLADNSNATSDLNTQDHPTLACSVTSQVLTGHTDWGPAPGQSIFTMPFQCSPFGAADGASGAGLQVPAGRPGTMSELNPNTAAWLHALYPIMPVKIEALTKPNATIVTLLGAKYLDVNEIEISSLRFRGAAALSVTIRDANGDGRPDLVAVFGALGAKLHSSAMGAILTGWLKDSQAFVGVSQATTAPRR